MSLPEARNILNRYENDQCVYFFTMYPMTLLIFLATAVVDVKVLVCVLQNMMLLM